MVVVNTSIIDNDKKNKAPYDTSISGMLQTFMQSQFEATIAQFRGLKLSETSPLHGLMNMGLSKVASPTIAPQNLSNISTSYKNKEITPAVPKTTENLSNIQVTQKSGIKPVHGSPEISSIVQRASQKHGVPVALINAVIKQESNFNPRAVSHCGAQGLMQLMPATGKAYGCTDAFNPEQNIMAGTKFLGDLLTKYNGDVTLSLAGYNAGPGNVAKYGNTVPPFKETQNYVVKVGQFYRANLATMEQTTQKFARMEQATSQEDA